MPEPLAPLPNSFYIVVTTGMHIVEGPVPARLDLLACSMIEPASSEHPARPGSHLPAWALERPNFWQALALVLHTPSHNQIIWLSKYKACCPTYLLRRNRSTAAT